MRSLIALLLASTLGAQQPRFEVTFPASLSNGPMTGRLFVTLFQRADIEPRIAAYQSARFRTGRVPIFAIDVEQLAPGQAAIVDAKAVGYPLANLKALPAGDYYAQAVLNVYTQYHRSDGHTIWAHQDHWEGQRWAYSPGNLLSTPLKVHLDPAKGFQVKLNFDHKIPDLEPPHDTKWVKWIRIKSDLLTKFWGVPQELGATILLPQGYEEHPDVHYPVLYIQTHFSLDPPFEFTDNPSPPPPPIRLAPPSARSNVESARPFGGGGKKETGYELYQSWMSDAMPRMILVTFQHVTPYFDDSYAVNSANNGPYGDAIMQELIPYVESHFRIIREPYARVLTGGSTGGWESLALQLYHPDFFGGTWTFYPDPIDFTRYQLVNIYEDANAFEAPGFNYVVRPRPMMRTVEGQVVETMRQMSQLEEVLGSHGRSGQQLEAWEAVYGPVGTDGYPQPLWDKQTGKIDRQVADYMLAHGYDLRAYAEKNWA